MKNSPFRGHLDNAATSFPKPPEVADAVARALLLPGNPRRGSGRSQDDATEVLEESRRELAAFIGGSAARLAFTLNATDALSGAIASLVRDGARAACAATEHNAVTRPLRSLRVPLVTIAPAPSGILDPDEVARAARGARLVAIAAASNVTGIVQPVAEIAARLPAECVLLVDAAQAAGSVALDVASFGPRAVTCLTGHKSLLGPMGCGAIHVGEGVDLPAWREGGTGDGGEDQPLELPARLESGTMPLPAIAGLAAGVAWWRHEGPRRVRARESAQLARILEALREIGARVACDEGAPRVPLASFAIGGFSPEEIAHVLESEHGVTTRAGLHCAPAAHRWLGTWPDGLVRASVGPTTRDEDVDALVEGLRALGP